MPNKYKMLGALANTASPRGYSAASHDLAPTSYSGRESERLQSVLQAGVGGPTARDLACTSRESNPKEWLGFWALCGISRMAR